MQALMVLRRNHMFVIIKKGENVNVCIHDFDDVKRRIKQGSFASTLIQDCFNKQSLDSRFLQDQALPQNERVSSHPKAHVIDYQYMCKSCKL